MNYRHDYHAGNFADVFKHVLLTRILLHLAGKPTAFRLIETHAGGGLYDLAGPQAEKTGEWRGGVGRLAGAELAPDARALLDPYLHIVAPFLGGERPCYPGSPMIARALLRRQDRMIFCELHPEARRSLSANLGADRRAKIIEIDGYAGLRAYIPPVERRGLVLIDPPFEDAAEFRRLGAAIEAAWRKWPTGIYLVWYPVKQIDDVAAFARGLAKSGIRPMLRIEIETRPATPRGPFARAPLARCGLIVVNPPFRFETDAKIILAGLLSCLGDGGGSSLVEWLAGE